MKPILFSTTMVQAILEGRKTQTRRVIKPANPVKAARMGGYSQGNGLWIDGYTDAKEAKGSIKDYSISPCWQRLEYYMRDYAPYSSGDILWVRETYFCEPCLCDCAGREDEAECPFNHVGEKCYGYKAQYTTSGEYLKTKWRSPRYMPREAARLFLRVTDVRVERVQDINYGDCCAEGVFDKANLKSCFDGSVATEKYRELWDALNAKRGYPWASNPWVWVYELERMEAPQ